jgi:hypothetical protein
VNNSCQFSPKSYTKDQERVAVLPASKDVVEAAPFITDSFRILRQNAATVLDKNYGEVSS